MDYKQYISKKLQIDGVNVAELLETPPDRTLGDYALPCFKLSKILHRSPVAIAEELVKNFGKDDVIESCAAVGGYLNFKINRKGFAVNTLKEITEKGEAYGSAKIGEGKTICIDYSSINIAKPFHIGHLSTTVIGSALCKIYRFLGYKVVGINHLGDYGTQFGKLIVAFKKWSSEEAVKEGLINAVGGIHEAVSKLHQLISKQ